MTELVVRTALAALAAYRVARLLALDTITLRFRKWLHKSAYPMGDDSMILHPWDWLFGLVSCPHCVGFWAALGAFAFWSLGHWATLIVAAVAAAGLQSYLASRADP